MLAISSNEKNRRKRLRLTQQELSVRADVSLPSLRRFEQKGEISLSALVRIAVVLDAQDGFLSLFPRQEYRSIEELLDAEHKEDRCLRRQ